MVDRGASGALTRLLPASFVFLLAVVVGGYGYWWIGDGRWELSECLYMSVVTISTVGFGETLDDMPDVPGARGWTVLLILLGSGTMVYFASALTAMIVEGDLQTVLGRNRMLRNLEKVQDHIIVCGVGATGMHVVAELAATRTPFVVIDRDAVKIDKLIAEHGEFPFVIDEATQDRALILAGIGRARGIVSALTDDRDNLYVTIAARALNDRLRIVSKCVADEAADKLRRAGANVVVSPSLIGGTRMASEMVRPTVVQFLDSMMRDRTVTRRIEEVAIPEQSKLSGKPLSRAGLRDFGDTLVLAVRRPDGSQLINPAADHKIESGQILIVLAEATQLARLREHCAARS